MDQDHDAPGGCVARWLLLVLLPLAANAEILVLVDGQRVQTRGPWKVEGRQVVYTTSSGHLASVKTSLVDFEASDLANLEQSAVESETDDGQRKSAVRITQDDVGTYNDLVVTLGQSTEYLESLDFEDGWDFFEVLQPSVERLVELDKAVNVLSPAGLQQSLALFQADASRFRALAARESDPELAKAFALFAADCDRVVKLIRSNPRAARAELSEDMANIRRRFGYSR